MLRTVEGIYHEGKIELSETPEGVNQARVLVTFLNGNGQQGDSQRALTDTTGHIKFGQFAGPEDEMATEEDFRAAEWGDDKIPEEFR